MITISSHRGPKAHSPAPVVNERTTRAPRRTWLERIEDETRAYCKHVANPSKESVKRHVSRALRLGDLRPIEIEKIENTMAFAPGPDQAVGRPLIVIE